MHKLNFAILGAGSIAHKMADTVRRTDDVAPYAIASRDLTRAQALADQYGFAKAYGSYEQMLRDPLVDLVYIATPHSHHAEQARQCLEAGKHVLCEKAFTANAKEAREIIELAKKKKLLIAEAIWPRYMPMAQTIRDFCASGKIGKISGMTANLGYPVSHVERIQVPELAGGALLDVGVYVLTFAAIAMGRDVCDISAFCVKNEQGVDMQTSIALRYGDGRVASLFCTVRALTDRMGMICGSDGYAIVKNVNNYESLQVYDGEYKLVEEQIRPEQITGFEYQVRACVKAIAAGQTECPEMPHSEILFIMEQMDAIREKLSIAYPQDNR